MRRLLARDPVFILAVLLPIVVLVTLFVYYPAANTFQTSLTSENLRIRKPAEEVGLRNYGFLLHDAEFWEVTRRSFVVVLLTLPLELGLGFLIALLLNERFPGRSIVRALVILPWMMPPVVNGFLWGWLLNGEYGALNGFLYQFGIIEQYRYWLRAPESQILWVVIVQTWTRFAFPTIILLAGLQSIPDDLYEAAKVDGAGGLARLRRITFPLLLPAFAVAMVIEFTTTFQIFDVVWTLTSSGGAGGTINPFTKTLMLFNYELVFRDLRIGRGAALSYLILLMSLAVGMIVVWRIYRQGVQE